jgi:glycosyltransferase involved in cell wall biosynthesis
LKKRICVISKFLYENDTRLQQQVNTLRSLGAKVDVLCLRSNYSVKEVDNNITIHGVAYPLPKETILKYIWNSVKFASACFYKLQKLEFTGKFDLIVIHTLPEILVFIAIIQKLRGTKLLLDIRDTSVELFNSKWGEKNKRLIKKLIKTSANLACSFADKIITASPGFQEKLTERNIPREKISIIYNSADTSIFRFDNKRKFKKITSGAKLIYHGTVANRFGVDIAIQALNLLHEKIPNSELRIFGFYEENYKKKLRELISKMNLEKFVFLNDRESLENIYKFIKISDIGIVPYRSDEFMQLALSTKMFEYIASGIPVVAARLRSAEFIFNTDCVLYATPDNPHEFAENIIRLCLNPDLRKSLVGNAIAAHNEVSGKVMSKLYLEIVSNLIRVNANS